MNRASALTALLVVGGLTSGCVLAEMTIRWLNRRPPAQVVRLLEQPQQFRPSLRHGEPVWKASADREHTDCAELHPERARILVFGDSVTYGVNLGAEQVFSALLETALNQSHPRPGFCVMNFAQPGFGFDQSFAVAEDEIARWKPALVLWESWGDMRKYVIVDQTAYMVNPSYIGASERLMVRPDGSLGLELVPVGLNRWLFDHSRLYEMLVLLWGKREAAVWEPLDARYERLAALVQGAGAKLVIYFGSVLDRPFADAMRIPPESEILEFAKARAVPLYYLAEQLRGEDYLALRMDPVGHFNAAGHAALARRFEPLVLHELPASSRADTGPSASLRRGSLGSVS